MTFSVDGKQYRIGFEHERPADWHYHEGHPVTLAKGELHCSLCHTVVAPMSPAIARALRATGSRIASLGAKVVADNHRRLVDRQYARNTRCIIYQWIDAEWVAIREAYSRLNTDEGDTFKREHGRIAALRAALPSRTTMLPEEIAALRAALPSRLPTSKRLPTMLPEEAEEQRRAFRIAAMAAYLGRKRGCTAGGGAA